MDEQRERLIALSAEGIKEVADEFADDIGYRPSCADLFEILTWALRAGDKDKLSDVHTSNIIALRPQMKKRDSRPDSLDRDYTGEAVAELNDAVFVAASDFLQRLVNAFKDATGRLPSLTDICDLLVAGLRQCDDLLLADIIPAQITGVKPEVRKQKKVTPRVGDIVAIPAENGGYFFAVVLDKNAFGTAYGLFEGTSRLKPVSKNSHPAVNPRPVYSGDDFIESGRWKIIGHDESLLSLFPEEPEIYHRQHADRPNPQLGPYGAGETASGKLRQLTREEAEEIGLLSGEYRQSYLPETLENYLNAKLK
jgi:immunity protein 26 of polymorphic toxin system